MWIRICRDGGGCMRITAFYLTSPNYSKGIAHGLTNGQSL